MPNIIAFGNETGGGGEISSTLLWENPELDINTSFSSQFLSIDLSSYDLVLIIYGGAGSNSQIVNDNLSSAIFPTYVSSYGATLSKVSWSGVTASRIYFYKRSCSISSTGINFQNGGQIEMYESTGTAHLNSTQNNSACMPYQIYGIKGITDPTSSNIPVIEPGTTGS